MAPTIKDIEKRLTAIEDRIEPKQPLIRFLDVYASPEKIEEQRAKFRAEAEAQGRVLYVFQWKKAA